MLSQVTNNKKEDILLISTYKYIDILSMFPQAEKASFFLKFYQASRLGQTHSQNLFPNLCQAISITYKCLKWIYLLQIFYVPSCYY